MAAVTLVKKQEAEDNVKAIFTLVEKEYGFVPNILKAIANCPEILTSFAHFWGSIYSSPYIEPRYRALAALGTAQTHDCKYCLSHMSLTAKKVGLSNDEIEATNWSNDNQILDKKESLIVEYASALTKDSGGITDDLLSRMKNHFNEAELVNLTLVVGLYNLTGRFLKALRIELEDSLEQIEFSSSNQMTSQT